MTRHGMIQLAVGVQPPATDPRAPMVIIDVDRVAPNRVPGRQYRAEAQRTPETLHENCLAASYRQGRKAAI